MKKIKKAEIVLCALTKIHLKICLSMHSFYIFLFLLFLTETGDK